MAERLDPNADIDFDQPVLGWDDLLALNPKCLGQILQSVPRANGVAGMLRTLAVHAWLREHRYPGLRLKTAFDDEGYPVEDDSRCPLLLVEVNQEDLSTRPAITCWKEMVALSGVDEHRMHEGMQWLDQAGVVDLDPVLEEYREQINTWLGHIEASEARWLRAHPSKLMIVASVEHYGRPVASFEITQEFLDLPGAERRALLHSATGSAHHAIAEQLREAFSQGQDWGDLLVLSVDFRVPSDKRRAELAARSIDEQTPAVSQPGRGARL